MAAEAGTEKATLMRRMFRRSSSAEHGEKELLVEVSMMPVLLNRMGQKVNEKQLFEYIKKHLGIDRNGHLNYENFIQICEKFLECPAALEKVKGDDFSFKHLINSEDFANP